MNPLQQISDVKMEEMKENAPTWERLGHLSGFIPVAKIKFRGSFFLPVVALETDLGYRDRDLSETTFLGLYLREHDMQTSFGSFSGQLLGNNRLEGQVTNDLSATPDLRDLQFYKSSPKEVEFLGLSGEERATVDESRLLVSEVNMAQLRANGQIHKETGQIDFEPVAQINTKGGYWKLYFIPPHLPRMAYGEIYDVRHGIFIRHFSLSDMIEEHEDYRNSPYIRIDAPRE